MEKNEKDQ